ncbi:transcriptional regulator FtrA [Roseomonas sp. SSH11]|uniref:Transcriptional regulator FtrA n=1 Tax=Pararoseomonas baculiformis TaxID=2820812 RepID=A0ABS4A8N5_9PROT|nr:transcriptional regulator FtrA [Pararoseomonas baculiformis]MBP0443357.1 transcriptional regulator FtrA [Pararoseomonas baculiformis]
MPKTPRPAPPANPLVVAIAYDGLCTFEYGVAVEVFALPRPEMGPGWYRFATAAIEEGPMRAMGGLRVSADGGMELLAQAGTVILPGWRGIEAPVPPALIEALRAAHGRGARILSFCSGAFVLAATGLLDGGRATTHWRYAGALAARHPAITVMPDMLYVDSGALLTAAGTAAGIDLCLHLIRRDHGVAAANKVARRLVVPPHREGGQAQFIERPVPGTAEGSRLSPLLDRMRGRLAESWPVDRMAAEAGMSRRSFIRHFRAATGESPAAWLNAARIGHAQALLEGTGLGMEAVAAQCGLGSPASLRAHFRARTGMAPAAWRLGFTGSSSPAPQT